MSGRPRVVVFAALFLMAVLVLELPDEQAGRLRPPAPARPAPSATQTPAPPQLSAAQIERQSQGSRRQRIQRRPLMQLLPIELAGVRIDVAGVGPHDRTILQIVPGPRGRAYAMALFQRALGALGDSGRSYVVRWHS